MKPLLSVVVPVFNSFNLMEKCLNSFKEQTNKNFEVIFVDDCSTDNSIELLSKWLIQNASFLYRIEKNEKNSGPGVSRNTGIVYSEGKYLTFVDSDDYIANDFVDVVVTTIRESSPDVIIFDYYKTDYNKISDTKSLLLSSYGLITTDDAVALSNGMCWGKIYKTQIIKDNFIYFPNLIRSEDLAFVKVYLSKCNKIFYCPKSLYYYYVNNDNSIMHSKKTLNIKNNIEAFKYIQTNVESGPAVEMVFIREYLYLIVQILILQNKNSKEIKKFINESNKIYINWYKNSYLKCQPLYLKLALFFIRINLIFPLKIMFKLKK